MHTNFNGQSIWLIGASSGIGRALAQALAGQGARLVLSARREEQLASLVEQLPGSGHWSLPLDIADFAALARAAEQIQASDHQLDRIICLAAIYQPMRMTELELDEVERIVRVNLTSQYHLSKHALELLPRERPSQLVFCGSVAGYVGLPNSQPYGGTKAGLLNMVESLRVELRVQRPHINVKIISPGFVATEMTAKNDFAMPMIITPEQAARYIVNGLRSSAFEIHFPKRFTTMLKALEVLPYGWRQRLLGRL